MSELAGTGSGAHLSGMQYLPHDARPEVAELQVRRYRQMDASDKLACADALWDLAWEATLAGVRMRRPDCDEAAAIRAARAVLDRAAD